MDDAMMAQSAPLPINGNRTRTTIFCDEVDKERVTEQNISKNFIRSLAYVALFSIDTTRERPQSADHNREKI